MKAVRIEARVIEYRRDSHMAPATITVLLKGGGTLKLEWTPDLAELFGSRYPFDVPIEMRIERIQEVDEAAPRPAPPEPTTVPGSGVPRQDSGREP